RRRSAMARRRARICGAARRGGRCFFRCGKEWKKAGKRVGGAAIFHPASGSRRRCGGPKILTGLPPSFGSPGAAPPWVEAEVGGLLLLSLLFPLGLLLGLFLHSCHLASLLWRVVHRPIQCITQRQKN